MIEQLKTIREFFNLPVPHSPQDLGEYLAEKSKAVQAAAQLEAMVGEPVATVTSETGNPDISMSWWHEPALPVGTKLYAFPVAQQAQAEPDAYCSTTPDGGCISTDPRCMHQPQAEVVRPTPQQIKAAWASPDLPLAPPTPIYNFVDRLFDAMQVKQQKGQP